MMRRSNNLRFVNVAEVSLLALAFSILSCDDAIVKNSHAKNTSIEQTVEETESVAEEVEIDGSNSVERAKLKQSEELTILRSEAGRITLGATSVSFSANHSALDLRVKLRRAESGELSEVDQAVFGTSGEVVVLEVFNQATNQKISTADLSDAFVIEYETDSDQATDLFRLVAIAAPDSDEPKRIYVDGANFETESSALRLSSGRRVLKLKF
jgi:hypothetical protein